MIKLIQEDVYPIILYSVEDFADWLRIGIENSQPDSPVLVQPPFAPLDVFIGNQENLTMDLKGIYDALPPQSQSNFRRGLAMALNRLPPEAKYVEVYKDFVSLGVEIRAYEILSVLPTKVGNGFFGLVEDANQQSVFISTLYAVAAMSGQEQDILNCLDMLINSRFFLPEYVDTALIALCQAAPERFTGHLKSLRGYLHLLLDSEKVDFDQVQDLAQQLVGCLQVPTIARHLQELKLYVRDKGDATDRWVLDALFSGDQPPLVCQDEEGFPCIRLRNRPEQEWRAVILDFDKNISQALDIKNALGPYCQNRFTNYAPSDDNELIEIVNSVKACLFANFATQHTGAPVNSQYAR